MSSEEKVESTEKIVADVGAVKTDDTPEKGLKMTGVKNAVENTKEIERIKSETGTSESSGGTPKTFDEEDVDVPSFFIDSEKRYRIDLDILFDKKTGKIVSVSKVGLVDDFSQFSFLGHVVEWLEFTQPNYEKISEYRKRSSVYRREAGRTIVDTQKMRDFFIVWHLKDWSLRSSDGKKIELVFDKSGALSDASVACALKLNPAVLDVALTFYESDILIV